MADEGMMTNREIDVLVAEKVMGWHKDYSWWANAEGDWMEKIEAEEYEPGFNPSEDIASAWQVVEKLFRVHKMTFSITLKDGDGWEAELAGWVNGISDIDTWGHHDEGSEVSFRGESSRQETAPLAICLAALKAVGAQVLLA